MIPADARAVLATADYIEIEQEDGDPGGITHAEVDDADIRPLGEFQDGQEVYVEGEAGDVLDDTSAERAAATRMWGRAKLIER
jgi:hypothetical protein